MADTQPHVLLVEDSRFLRAAAEAMLAARGFRVTTAADGEEAIRHCESIVPDLIVMDWVLPKLQGIELLEKFKSSERVAHVPVIVLTGIGKTDCMEKALNAGAAGFIDKARFSLEGVYDRIQDLLTMPAPANPVGTNNPPKKPLVC